MVLGSLEAVLQGLVEQTSDFSGRPQFSSYRALYKSSQQQGLLVLHGPIRKFRTRPTYLRIIMIMMVMIMMMMIIIMIVIVMMMMMITTTTTTTTTIIIIIIVINQLI